MSLVDDTYKFNGEQLQDYFVMLLLNKKYGTFIEIGSNDPIKYNNTFLLENSFGWKGIMVELENKYLNLYKQYRPNSVHIIDNALNINYIDLFLKNNIPTNIDYLSFDIHEDHNLIGLQLFDKQIFDKYKFACITFEHNLYMGRYEKCREESRDIFKNRGYILLFPDIRDFKDSPLEDWYVHPDLVNSDLLNKILEIEKLRFEIIKKNKINKLFFII